MGGNDLQRGPNILVRKIGRLAHSYPSHQFVLATQPITIDWEQSGVRGTFLPIFLGIKPLGKGRLPIFWGGGGFGSPFPAPTKEYSFSILGILPFTTIMLMGARGGGYLGLRTQILKRGFEEGM